MIRVKCLGHIRTSLGTDEVCLEGDSLEASEIVEKLRAMASTRDVGFNRFNTLAMVGHGEAFVSAVSSRKIRDGETVILIPFSHGG